jgi:hypothetical protein
VCINFKLLKQSEIEPALGEYIYIYIYIYILCIIIIIDPRKSIQSMFSVTYEINVKICVLFRYTHSVNTN